MRRPPPSQVYAKDTVVFVPASNDTRAAYSADLRMLLDPTFAFHDYAQANPRPPPPPGPTEPSGPADHGRPGSTPAARNTDDSDSRPTTRFARRLASPLAGRMPGAGSRGLPAVLRTGRRAFSSGRVRVSLPGPLSRAVCAVAAAGVEGGRAAGRMCDSDM